MNTIAIENISKSFDGRQVLNDINLSLNEGEITGILGPSGSGKTTLIRLIIGMLAADNGKVHIMDKKIPNLEILQNIGYMAQSDALYEDLSGFRNLIFFACVNGMKSIDAKKNAIDVLNLTGLYEDRDKLVKHYSGGMKRRLSLAISLIHNPQILILDEPTVGIDPLLREVFWEEFNRRKKLGSIVLITTHVMDEAEKCDKIVLIRDGKIIAYGTPKELKEKTKLLTLEEVFLKYSRKAEESK